MAFAVKGNPVKFMGSMDPEGHREYKVKYLVETTSNQDGPAAAMQASGLPLVGSTYVYGNDVDLWAWRQPGLEVEECPGHQQGDFPFQFFVTCTFSTKPRRRDQERPHDNQIQDPLSEPQKISGGSVSVSEVAVEDRFGTPVRYSSFEPITGPANEWDNDKDTITIEQNVPQLQLALCSGMKNTVNGYPMWGCPARSIRLSKFDHRRNWGKNNNLYFTRTFTFEIRIKYTKVRHTTIGSTTSGSTNITITGTALSSLDIGSGITGPNIPLGTVIVSVSGGSIVISQAATSTRASVPLVVVRYSGIKGDWDRDILDESGKCLAGFWDESVSPVVWVPYNADQYDNPAAYQVAVDRVGTPTRLILDGFGSPWDSSMGDDSTQGKIHVEKFPESNFFLLNIPVDLEH